MKCWLAWFLWWNLIVENVENEIELLSSPCGMYLWLICECILLFAGIYVFVVWIDANVTTSNNIASDAGTLSVIGIAENNRQHSMVTRSLQRKGEQMLLSKDNSNDTNHPSMFCIGLLCGFFCYLQFLCCNICCCFKLAM